MKDIEKRRLVHARALVFHFLIGLLVACPFLGRGQQQQLHEKDYGLWGSMDIGQVSRNGTFVSFRMRYESGNDTLFVRNTKTLKTFAFAKGRDAAFDQERWFACTTENGLSVLDLKSNKMETIPNVADFRFANGYLIYVAQGAAGKMTVRSGAGDVVKEISNMKHWKISPDGRAMLCDNGRTLSLLAFGKAVVEKEIFPGNDCILSNITWQDNSKTVAFTGFDNERNKTNRLFHYNLETRKCAVLDPAQANIPDGFEIKTTGQHIDLSRDGKGVFFRIGKVEKIKDADPAGVQVWNAADGMLWPARHNYSRQNDASLVMGWYPETRRLFAVTSDELPGVIFTPGHRFAITYNAMANESQNTFTAQRDYYITNLLTGEKTLMLGKANFALHASPTGKYIAYFKSGSWWVYNTALKSHKNLTGSLPTNFTKANHDQPKDAPPAEKPDWTANDGSILLCDQYDIWEVPLDGGKAKRLTRGREKQVVFRFLTTKKADDPEHYKQLSKVYDLSTEQLLYAVSEDFAKTGVYSLQQGKAEKQLFFEEYHAGDFREAKNRTVAFVRQRFDVSPQLMYWQPGRDKAKVIFQSNAQQQRFNWGTAANINYNNSKGQKLHGVLFYPSNYDPKKSYPMVVHIYERQSQLINHYVNPSVYDSSGFNLTHYTLNGYFVLYPDIAYEIGQPGPSALDCVAAATKAAMATASIDPKAIGLIGHSFGGYEVNYILTQTNLFAAAVSGAGIADLVSHYLNINENTGKSDIWRFEQEQLRMGAPLFEDRANYLANSPLWQAQNISTPLLSWTGDKDQQVNAKQSTEFFLALQRLGKIHQLLVYPGEGHTIMAKEFQKDLCRRVADWFGNCLKREL